MYVGCIPSFSMLMHAAEYDKHACHDSTDTSDAFSELSIQHTKGPRSSTGEQIELSRTQFNAHETYCCVLFEHNTASQITSGQQFLADNSSNAYLLQTLTLKATSS